MKEHLIRLYHFSNTWTGTIIIVLLIIFFLAQAFVIPSGSMRHTLLIGDHLFVKKFSYGIPTPHIPFLEIPVLPDFDGDGHLIAGDKPKRGDIVIFRYPLNPKMHYVKRCVATGGDIVWLVDKELYIRPKGGDEVIRASYPKELITEINGVLWVKDPYQAKYPGVHYDPKITPDIGAPEELFNFGPYQVPEGQFFMMGDNRDHSQDSRFWGPVEYKHIVGKPWFIYFSWDSNYRIRWERVGRIIDTLELEAPLPRYSSDEVTGLH
ncbi:MAG: signal peptidase I [Campylobacterales bacterium]